MQNQETRHTKKNLRPCDRSFSLRLSESIPSAAATAAAPVTTAAASAATAAAATATTAAIAATAAAAAAAIAAAAIAAAATAFFTRTGNVYGQTAPLHFLVMKHFNRFLGIGFIHKFHKPKPFRAMRFTFHNQHHVLQLTRLTEQIAQVLLRDLIRKITDVQLVIHFIPPQR
jgi:hypothetical protein